MANIGQTITLSGSVKTGYAPGVEQWTVGQGQQLKILNTRTVNGQLYYDVQHIGGGTGWVSASSVDAANKPIQAQPSKISPTVNAGQVKAPTQPALVGNQKANVLQSMGPAVAQATQSLTNNIAAQQQTNAAELAAAEKQKNDALKGIEKNTTPFRQDVEQKGRAKYETEEVLSDQKALLDELDTLLTEGNNLIQQQQEVTGLAAIRNPRIQKTMDDVAARAGVINAVVSLQNTYLANAYQAIDRTVSAMTGDRQDQISYYESVLQLADNKVIELTSEKRRLAQEQTNILKLNLEQGLQTANYIKELMVNPDTAMDMAKAGVTLNDNVEQINVKLSKYQNDKQIREDINAFTSQGAQEIYNPAGVPAHQLLSYTDPNGKVHYFKVPEEPKTAAGGGMTVDDFLKFREDNPDMFDTFNDGGNDDNVGIPPNYSPDHLFATYEDPTNSNVWVYLSDGWKKVS